MKTIDVLLAAFLASLLVLINVIISYQMGGWAASYASFYSFKNIPDMTGKNVFVTGINSGIGKITAIELARKGATVYGTVRSLEKADFVQEVNRGLKGKVVPLQLDLADLASVEAAAKQLLRMNLKSLDVLINNAAVMMTPPSLSAEGVEAQFATK